MTKLNMVYHPSQDCPSVNTLQVAVTLESDGCLVITYTLEADLHDLLIPAKKNSVQKDGLWEHTCFEAFIGFQGEKNYYEYNFSPSTEWAGYAFSDYRERIKSLIKPAPLITVEQFDNQLKINVVLNKQNLPRNSNKKTLRLGLTAVIETKEGCKSYWALMHPADCPDFHNKNGFIFKLCP